MNADPTPEVVAFITIEEGDDLIVSFAIAEEPGEIAQGWLTWNEIQKKRRHGMKSRCCLPLGAAASSAVGVGVARSTVAQT